MARDKPKAKFLLINLPFKTLTVKRLAIIRRKPSSEFTWKKPARAKIHLPCVFWDGKKYKYQQLGSTLE